MPKRLGVDNGGDRIKAECRGYWMDHGGHCRLQSARESERILVLETWGFIWPRLYLGRSLVTCGMSTQPVFRFAIALVLTSDL